MISCGYLFFENNFGVLKLIISKQTNGNTDYNKTNIYIYIYKKYDLGTSK